MMPAIPLTTQAYRAVIEIDGLPKITTNAKYNWRGRWAEGKKWKGIVETHIIFHHKRPIEPLRRAKVTCIRYAHGRQPDFENLCSSFKHILDGLVKARVLIDDSPEVIGQPVYEWVKASPGQGKIKVVVEEVA